MKNESKNTQLDDITKELYEALLMVKNIDEMSTFMKDLCTPQEIRALGERWRVCKVLNQGTLSYREISKETGASLTTIGRVARFLKEEPHQGYQLILNRIGKRQQKK